MSNKELSEEEKNFIREQLAAFGNEERVEERSKVKRNDTLNELNALTSQLTMSAADADFESDDDDDEQSDSKMKFKHESSAANVGDTWVPAMDNSPIQLDEDDQFGMEPIGDKYAFNVETIPSECHSRADKRVKMKFGGMRSRAADINYENYQDGTAEEKETIKNNYLFLIQQQAAIVKDPMENDQAKKEAQLRKEVLLEEWKFVQHGGSFYDSRKTKIKMKQSKQAFESASAAVEEQDVQTTHGEKEGLKALQAAFAVKQPVCINLKLGRFDYMKLYAQPSKKDSDEFVIGTVLNESKDKPKTMARVNLKSGKMTHSKTWVPTMLNEKGENANTLEKAIRVACCMAKDAARCKT